MSDNSESFKTVSGGRIQCPSCQRTYASIDNLREHIHDKHKSDSVSESSTSERGQRDRPETAQPQVSNSPISGKGKGKDLSLFGAAQPMIEFDPQVDSLIAGSATQVGTSPAAPPTVDEIKNWDTNQLISHLQVKVHIGPHNLDILKDQEIDGDTLLDLEQEELERWGMAGGPAKKIIKYVNELKGTVSESLGSRFTELRISGDQFDFERQIDFEREKTKQIEADAEARKAEADAEARKAEADARKAEAEARKAEAEANSKFERFRMPNIEQTLGSVSRAEIYKRQRPSLLTTEQIFGELRMTKPKNLPTDIDTHIKTCGKLPNDSLEAKIQGWFHDLMTVVNKVWKGVKCSGFPRACDTSNHPYLNTLKPDFSVFDYENSVDGSYFPMFVRTVLELKRRKGQGFLDSEKGQLMDYILAIAQHQPLRNDFMGFLSDSTSFYVMTYHRDERQFGEVSTTLNDGLLLFYTMLAKDTIYTKVANPKTDMTRIYLKRFLGKGSSGIVYETEVEKTPAVVKICLPGREHSLKHECEVLRILKENSISNIPVCIEHKGNSMLMQPLCAKSEYGLRRDQMKSLVSLLKTIHRMNIVHRDIRPSNIMLNANGDRDVVLIDWGAAVTNCTDIDEPIVYEGTKAFASSSILEAGLTVHMPKPADDLHSLVRTFYKFLHPLKKVPTSDNTVGEILAFWDIVLEPCSWQELEKAAEDLNYDDILNICDFLSV